jgi:glycosyltransferase involved in cell wall biosynthesis
VKIAIIISNTRDPDTGTATVSINLARKFRLSGHSCDLIFKEDVLGNATWKLEQVFFTFALPFKKALRQYDVLDINAGDGLFVAALLAPLRRAKRPVLIARSHGLEHVIHEARLAQARAGTLKLSWKYPLYHGGYRLWQIKKYLQRVDMGFFLNSYDRDYAVDRLGMEPARARIVDNGLPDLFIGREFDPTVPSQIKISMVGSFIERKGIRYSVPALTLLLQKNANLSLGFFGPRVRPDEILEQFPQALRDRIEIKEKYLHEELPALLSSYQILLFASLGEGFGLAPLEGMACGLAVVVTDIPSIAERLEHEVNALIIPPRDQRAIQDSLQRLIDDPELLTRLRRAGHAMVQNFSWTRVADDTLRLYQEAIDQKASEAAKKV